MVDSSVTYISQLPTGGVDYLVHMLVGETTAPVRPYFYNDGQTICKRLLNVAVDGSGNISGMIRNSDSDDMSLVRIIRLQDHDGTIYSGDEIKGSVVFSHSENIVKGQQVNVGNMFVDTAYPYNIMLMLGITTDLPSHISLTYNGNEVGCPRSPLTTTEASEYYDSAYGKSYLNTIAYGGEITADDNYTANGFAVWTAATGGYRAWTFPIPTTAVHQGDVLVLTGTARILAGY